jgi:hypothetical protein
MMAAGQFIPCLTTTRLENENDSPFDILKNVEEQHNL